MSFPLTDLDGHRFNQLVGDILAVWLGAGIKTYSTGKDGGTDGDFEGTAKCFPDEKNPLSGKFKIQAKWTSYTETCADTAFQRQLHKEEVQKAKAFVDAGQLDHWLIFTNRRKAAGSGTQLEDGLRAACGAKSVHLRADEDIQRFLRLNPTVAQQHHLCATVIPLRVRPDELGQIVGVLYTQWKQENAQNRFNYASYPGIERKNIINRLTDDQYAHIQKSSAPYFNDIEGFLKNPRNVDLRDQYCATAEEFQGKVLAHSDRFENFGQILEALFEEVVSGLQSQFSDYRQRRILRVVLHYMYCNCDIGASAS